MPRPNLVFNAAETQISYQNAASALAENGRQIDAKLRAEFERPFALLAQLECLFADSSYLPPITLEDLVKSKDDKVAEGLSFFSPLMSFVVLIRAMLTLATWTYE